ncbi:MAG: hypothetical protein QG597_556 [Actinomycetota bacterium]|nr:hypothetical protein [Actinomycetota bacterium]
MTPGGYGDSETGFMRRAVEGALDATVGRVGDRVGDTARGLTEATAKQVIDDLEPYLIAETVPRIVDGLTPYLIETIVPDVVDGVSRHIAEVTVPEVMMGATPALVEQILPQLMDQLQPYLELELVPRVVDALVPHLNASVAPELVDALMPKIEQEVAPRLVFSLMPMIRAEVVPQILDDIVDDPKVRDLIREQSQGMILDGLERVRKILAQADDVVEKIVRRLFRRKARPLPGPLDVPALPSRRYVNAGVFSRGVALAVDFAMVGFLVSIGLNAIVSLLQNLTDPLPQWVTGLLAFISLLIFPSYLAVSWMLTGNTIAQGVFGLQECTDDGRRMLPLRALVKAWTQVLLLPLWIWGMIFSPFSRTRKGLLDMLTHTQVRYFVHGESVEEPRRRLLKGDLGAP